MPLDVTAVLPATGSGAAGVSGASDAGPPPGGPAALFASLLAQQAKPAPITAAKTTVADAAPAREMPDKKVNAEETADPQMSMAQGPLDPTTINWAMLATMQAPPPALTPTALPAGDTPASGAPAIRKETIRKEVMDTASLSVPAALPAQTGAASSELLPLDNTTPQAKTALPAEGSIPVHAETGASQTVDLSHSEESAAAPPRSAPPVVAPPFLGSPNQAAESVGPALKWPETADSASTPPKDASASLPVRSAADAAPVPVSVESADIVSGSASPVSPAAVLPVGEASFVAVAQGLPKSAPAFGAPVGASGAAQKPVVNRAILGAPNAAPPAPTFFARPTSLTEITSPTPLQNAAVPANNTGVPDTRQKSAFAEVNIASAQAGQAGEAPPIASPVMTPVTDAPAAASWPAEVAKEQGRMPAQGVLPEGTLRNGVSDDPKAVRPDDNEDKAGGQEKADQSIPVMQPLPTPSAEAKSPVAAVAQQKPLTGAERAQVVRQTAEGVSTLKPHVLSNGHGQMTVNLHPKEWGDLRVTVQLAPAPPADGAKQTAVTAHVVAGSAAVKAALESHTDDLSRALRQSGLHLEHLTVAVQAAGASGQSGGAAGEGRNSGHGSQDQWQAAQPQANSGGSGLASGGSSMFNSFSGQGGGAFQNQSGSRVSSPRGDENGPDILPVSEHTPKHSAGFDQRV